MGRTKKTARKSTGKAPMQQLAVMSAAARIQPFERVYLLLFALTGL